MIDDGELKDYLGSIFERNKKYGSVTLTQPQMVEIVLGLNYTSENVKIHETLAYSNKLLENDLYGKPRLQKFNYRAVIGCLIYCNVIVRTYITMATQQCARFFNSSSREQEEAANIICRYLPRTKEKGLVLNTDKQRGLGIMLMLIGKFHGSIDISMVRSHQIPGQDKSSFFPVVQLCDFPR